MNKYEELLRIFKALGDPVRLRIVNMLSCEELCACRLLEGLSIVQSTLSHHMKILTDCGIVTARKESTWMYYGVNNDSIAKLHGLIDEIAKKQNDCICYDKNNMEDKMSEKLKVLFLCTGNSCRSQMAEGWAKHLKSDSIDAFSAGTDTHGLNPNAVKVMKEAGVDISAHKSKNVKELMNINFDYVVTVCGHANENCPFFPGKAKIIHVGFDDPPQLAKNASTEEEGLNHYRRVRDEIKKFIETLPESLIHGEQ